MTSPPPPPPAPRCRVRFAFACLAAGLLSATTNLAAANLVSGGRVLHVDQSHPQADDAGDGESTRPFLTISAATLRAGAGDTVYVHPGVYREHIAPVRGGSENAPVTWQAAPGHRVFVRGSEVWQPAWQPLDDEHPGVFTAPLDDTLFAGAVRNPYRTIVNISSKLHNLPARPAASFSDATKEWLAGKQPGRLPRTLGQLFVDGQPLRESETRAEVLRVPGTWIVNETGDGLVVHFPISSASATPPAQRLVELTVRDRIFAPAKRGLKHIIVRGFVFEHAANQGPFPQLGAVSLRSGKNWIVEDNIIRHAKTIGIDAGSETYSVGDLLATNETDRRLIISANNIVRNNEITDNGLCGLAAWNCSGLVVEGNRVERNNALGFRPKVDHHNRWEEHAGIKLHGATGARIEQNLVRDNDAHGIWIDNGFTNARITRNVILANAGGGIVMELGNGPALIDHNIIAFTRPYSSYYAGDGIYGHDSSGITIAHNLSYANARHGVHFRRISDRKIGGKPAEASRLSVRNNLLIDNAATAINLPPNGLRSQDNTSDHNVISERHALFSNPGKGPPLSIDEWRKTTGRDTSSVIENPRSLILRPHTQEIEYFPGQAALRPIPATTAPYGFPGSKLLPSGDRVLAGPWQDIDAHNQRFFLWP
ncbi:right-handed parallel beta-helix repeat-containing protein [Opitutaceae bacterium TAV3]|nr:right-handed parallel beta-helix repeat-containing protein [Opitutaceae bacterium TAV3]